MNMHGQDTDNSQNFLEHFAPNDSMISYLKLRKFVIHQINEYEKVQRGIEENALYYVYSEPETIKDYKMLSEKIEEWQWFLDNILDDDFKINAITL
jgi:hypothetical protein